MKIDLTGKKFGNLIVESFAGLDKNKFRLWNVLCICGKRKKTVQNSLTKGLSKSCGCNFTSKEDYEEKVRKDLLKRRKIVNECWEWTG